MILTPAQAARMLHHEHAWHTMTTGQRGQRWQRCTAVVEICGHGPLVRAWDALRRRPHHWRWHAVWRCDAQRMVKGGPW